MIERSHGLEAAACYRAFHPNDAERNALAEVGIQLLKIFPTMPAACVVMSALYSCRLQAVTEAPAYVAAGALSVGQAGVFGENKPLDGKTRFSQSNLSWDGHACVLFGGYIADASIFRTAYSTKSPPILAAHVLKEFGKGQGLFICKADDAIKSGLNYTPQYVLSEEQTTGLARGVMAIIDSHRARQ